MSYWKTKVLPKINKVFGNKKDAAKKAAAVEACKSFDDCKEELSKEFEEKKADLQPKVLKIYEASSDEIKTLVKDPKEADLKEHSAKVQNFFDELVKIEFPGSKVAYAACSKFGLELVPGPAMYILEKVSTVVVTEEKPTELEAPAAAEEETKETDEAEKEIVAAAAPAETAPHKDDPPKAEEPQAEVPTTKTEQPSA